jgi:hypothetical protein
MNIKHDQNNNLISISQEQAKQSKAFYIVQFLVFLSASANIEKVIYYVKSKKTDLTITVWESYTTQYEKRKLPNGEEKQIHRGIIQDVVKIINNQTEEVFYSDNGSNNLEEVEINGVNFPSHCIISNGMAVIKQLESDGQITKAINFVPALSNEVLSNIDNNESKDVNTTINIDVCKKDGSSVKKKISPKLFNSANDTFFDEIVINDVITINIENFNGTNLTIHKQKDLFAIGIIDEINRRIFYYDNKEKTEESIELNGETFPSYMITSDVDKVKEIIYDYIKCGTATKKCCWIEEEY